MFTIFRVTFVVDVFLSYTAGKSRFGSLLSLGHSGKTDRLYMKGPGGRGEVEVAVSGVAGKRLLSLYKSVDVINSVPFILFLFLVVDEMFSRNIIL